MANAADQLSALLIEQHELVSHLEPFRTELFVLLAKLRDLGLEKSHGEITAYLELAEKQFGEAILAEQKARDHRKELELEFLGSEVESEGGADSDGEARPVKEKDKWNSKIIAQVEKMSATKFLEFCEEQRCIVGNIWGCSANLQRSLNRIVDGGVAEETFTESDDNISAYADTTQSEASSSNDSSSGTNELQQEIGIAYSEIEQLKSRILELESQNQAYKESSEAIRSKESKVLNLKIEGLRVDTEKARASQGEAESKLEAKTAELATANLKISTLQKELKMKQPLFDVGAKVRCGFLQSIKRVWSSGGYVTTNSSVDLNAIWSRNEAVHRGNYEADKALFDLKILKKPSEKADFYYAYQIIGIYDLSVCPKALALVNYRGTLIACGFLTKYSHNSTEIDKVTESEFKHCMNLWLPIFSSRNIDREKQKAFEKNTAISTRSEALKRITEGTVKKERTRMFG